MDSSYSVMSLRSLPMIVSVPKNWKMQWPGLVWSLKTGSTGVWKYDVALREHAGKDKDIVISFHNVKYIFHWRKDESRPVFQTRVLNDVRKAVHCLVID